MGTRIFWASDCSAKQKTLEGMLAFFFHQARTPYTLDGDVAGVSCEDGRDFICFHMMLPEWELRAEAARACLSFLGAVWRPCSSATHREPRTTNASRITKLTLHQDDHNATVCDETTCTRAFSYFTRRHHCRRCGNIFCDAHSPYTVPLDQHANYHPKGAPSRACQFCHTEYKGWEIARSSRSSSQSSTDSADTPRTPTMDTPIKTKGMGLLGVKADGIAKSLGASVPRDWNWSTF